MTRFCENLPEEAPRPFTDEERGRVAAARRGWTFRCGLRAALVPSALVSGLPVAHVFSYSPDTVTGGTIGAFAIALGVLLAFPAAILYLRDAVRIRGQLTRDLAGGEALVFRRDGRSIAILPVSRRVLERDGAPGDLATRAELGEASPPPAAAPTYSVPLTMEADEVRAHGWVKRPLTPQEHAEIAAHSARLGRFPIGLVAASFVVLAVSFARVRGDDAAAGVHPALLAGWVALVVLGWWRAARNRALAAKLRDDDEDGWAVRATTGEHAGVEALPNSGVHWTAGGAPARWRLRAGRRLRREAGAAPPERR